MRTLNNSHLSLIVCIVIPLAISAATNFPLLKKLPDGFCADSEWYESCNNTGNVTNGLFDIDADGIPDSIYLKRYKTERKYTNWKRFSWVEVAFSLSRTRLFFVIPAKIGDGPSPIPLVECCGDCPNALQFYKEKCDTSITIGFTHGFPPDPEIPISGDRFYDSASFEDSSKYYYPMEKWMTLVHQELKTEKKLEEELKLPLQDIAPATRSFWLRRFYVKIAGQKAVIFTALELDEVCGSGSSQKK